MTRVLLVDDDRQLLRALRINLTARGYDVVTAADAATALRAAADTEPDLDGTDVIGELRRFSAVPIVVLSARTDSSDKVGALDRGADDYVTKPFGVDELAARLRAAVRRAGADGGPHRRVDAGDLSIDLADRVVNRAGEPVRLTPTEWSILELLVQHPGRLVGRRELLRHIWGPAERKDTSYLRVYLAQLRRKLEADPAHPRHLITEAGLGYRFRP